jgi:hypothetical protein
MRNRTLKGFASIAAILMIAIGPSVQAGSLHQGSTGSSGAAVTGSLPGQVLWTYYQTDVAAQLCPPGTGADDALCNTSSRGDNIIRLINPNGAANGNLAGARTQTVCAMIYVFDDDEEMGECCGCPLSSAQLATFSVDHNLTSDWALPQIETGTLSSGFGAIAIVATTPNTVGFPLPFGSVFVNTGGGGPAGNCLGAACCDPTNNPGYAVTTASNLLGSITHHQSVYQGCPVDDPECIVAVRPMEITETALSDDAGGDPINLNYLQSQCGAVIGNGTGGGVCTCPIE